MQEDPLWQIGRGYNMTNPNPGVLAKHLPYKEVPMMSQREICKLATLAPKRENEK